MKRKSWIAGFAMLVGAFSLQAADLLLRLTDADGRSAVFAVDASLRLRVEADMVLIESADSCAQFSLSELTKIGYESLPTGIQSPSGSPGLPVATISGESISILIPDGVSFHYAIFDSSAKRVSSAVVQSKAVINIGNFAPGIYFLRGEGIPTLKFTKR